MNQGHGGRRDNRKRRSDDERGGARSGAGRPISTIRIGAEAARKLRDLLRSQNIEYSEDAVNAWVEAQIRAAG